MKFKVGDYAKPKDGHAKECGSYGNDGSYIKITGLLDDGNYVYEIYDYRVVPTVYRDQVGQSLRDEYINWCSRCFKDAHLEPYTPQLKVMDVEEEVEVEEPKQTKPQLTYKRDIIYTRSDGIVFRKDEITYNGQFISVETLRLYSNLYKAWKGRKFDE